MSPPSAEPDPSRPPEERWPGRPRLRGAYNAAYRATVPLIMRSMERSRPAPPIYEAEIGAAPEIDPTAPPAPKTVRDRFSMFREENRPFFRKLGVYLRPYRTRFLLGQMCGIAFAVFNATIPLIMRSVLQTVPGGAVHPHHAKPGFFTGMVDNMAHTSWGILLMCSSIPLVMVLRGIFDYLDGYCSAWVSLKVLGDMRRDLFTRITEQSLQFFHQHRSGHLISRVANDTRIAQTMLGIIGADLIKQPICVVFGVAALLAIDGRFTLVALVLFPVCIIPAAVYGKRIRKSGRQEEELAGAMSVILQETFAGIRVIKSFAREGFQIEQFQESNNSQFRNAIRVRQSTEIVGPMVEVVAAIGVGLALLYVHYRGMDLGKFVSLITGLFLLYNPIKQISRMHLLFQKCQAATMNIFALMDLKADVLDAPDAVDLTHCRGDIAFNQVHFYYPGATTAALRDFDVKIKAGKYIALVGVSGAGKSTMLSLLQRFYDPVHGSVMIDGLDLRTLTQKSVRENIGVVTQDTFLFHDTIYKNIVYGRLDATRGEVEEAARQAYAHDFIMALPEGYETRIGDKGCRLSGGQQQRLAIARALLKNAPILLLDEATSALDSESELMIQNALERLVVGRTVIAIAHRLSTILKADRIIVMEGGEIVEMGKHARLYQLGGRYRRLYDLQFDQEIHAAGMEAATPAGELVTAS